MDKIPGNHCALEWCGLVLPSLVLAWWKRWKWSLESESMERESRQRERMFLKGYGWYRKSRVGIRLSSCRLPFDSRSVWVKPGLLVLWMAALCCLRHDGGMTSCQLWLKGWGRVIFHLWEPHSILATSWSLCFPFPLLNFQVYSTV